MIPYTVGKLASNSSHLTRGLVEYVPGRSYFRAVSSQNGIKFVTTPPPPPIVEITVRVLLGACAAGKAPEVVLIGCGGRGREALYACSAKGQ